MVVDGMGRIQQSTVNVVWELFAPGNFSYYELQLQNTAENMNGNFDNSFLFQADVDL